MNVCLNRAAAKAPRLDEMDPLDDTASADPRAGDPGETSIAAVGRCS